LLFAGGVGSDTNAANRPGGSALPFYDHHGGLYTDKLPVHDN
jgi:hypothetical protein